MKRVCKDCDTEKDISEYEQQSPTTWRKVCKKCRNIKVYQRKKETGAYDKRKEKQRLKRHDPQHRSKFVVSDSNTADKNNNMTNNLTVEHVDSIISEGCSYCGIEFGNDDNIKIGVDRIDHNKPHDIENVVPCCSRCNFIRRTLPYDVWLMIVPSIRKAVQDGMLDDWEWGFKRHFNAIKD